MQNYEKLGLAALAGIMAVMMFACSVDMKNGREKREVCESTQGNKLIKTRSDGWVCVKEMGK